MKKLLSLFFVVLLAGQAFTADAEVNVNELTLCEGEYMSAAVPIYGFYTDVENTIGQMIYPAEMLEDMVGCEITAVKFYTTAYYYNNYGNPGSINNSDLINFDGATIELSFMVVDESSFTGRIEGTARVACTMPEYGDDNMTFYLDEPFYYVGGNLLVECKVIEAGEYGSTYFLGDGFEEGTHCSYYGYEWYGSWTEYCIDFLPMVTFTYNEEVVTPPIDEETCAPVITLERLEEYGDNYYAYVLYIAESEPSDIYCRVLKYYDYSDEWESSEWMEYEAPQAFVVNGLYRVEAYAIAEGKLPSVLAAIQFYVQVPDYPVTTPGDLNGDKVINVADVTALIKIILDSTPVSLDLADVNGDGQVNVADVTALIQIVLNSQ